MQSVRSKIDKTVDPEMVTVDLSNHQKEELVDLSHVAQLVLITQVDQVAAEVTLNQIAADLLIVDLLAEEVVREEVVNLFS